MSEVTTIPGSGPNVAPLGSALKMSLETYQWGKGLVVGNKLVGPRMAPLFDFTESTTLKLVEVSPIKYERVIDGVDSRVAGAVTYGSSTVQRVREAPGKFTTKSLTAAHGQLNRIKVDKDEAGGELGFSTVVDDCACIGSERLSMMLDASEGYLAQYLPLDDEDKEELKVEVSKGEFKPLVWRAGRQSKVAAKRLQEQMASKYSGFKARGSEVVHVDLLKYSAFLDKQKSAVASFVNGLLDAVDQKALQPAKSAAERGAETLQARVLAPARERIGAVRLPFQDNLVRFYTVLGDNYESKVATPRKQMIAMFRKELAMQQEIQRAKNSTGEEKLTIKAGAQAVYAAGRARLSKEFEERLSPFFNSWMGRSSDVNSEVNEDEDEGEEEKQLYEEDEDSE